MKNLKKNLAFICSLALVFTLFSGCGGSSSIADNINADVAGNNGGYELPEDILDNDSSLPKENNTKNQNEKLVYRCQVSIETTNYPETIKVIKEQINKFDGILEYEKETDNAYHWYYSDYEKTNGTLFNQLRIRIPTNKYEEFLTSVEGQGKVTGKEINVENISKQYFETEAVIESLEIQEDRLLSMMDKAETIQDMVTIEQRLTDVQMQLNKYNTLLSTMDTDVQYSTITLEVTEVMEYSPAINPHKTNKFVDRLKNTIIDSWSSLWALLEGLLFLIIRFIPFGLVFALIAVPIILIVSKHKKNKSPKVPTAIKPMNNEPKKPINDSNNK